VHHGTIDDVIQSDDPLPALGVLYPLALMFKHGKISMELLTSEAGLPEEKPRRRFRDLLRRPRWRTLLLTALLFALGLFLSRWEPTRNNLGLLLGWPHRLAERILGPPHPVGTPLGALGFTFYSALDLLFLYICAALILRQRRDAGAG